MAIRNKKSSLLMWSSGHKFASTALFLLILVAGFFVYQRIALEMNEHAFQQARVTIDTIYADIASRVGKPDNFKRTNDCSRPSQEFEQGPLSCSVDTDFIYGVTDEQAANALFKQIQGVISLHKDLIEPIKPLDNSIKDTLVVNSYYHSAEDYYKTSSMDCSVKYTYSTPREIDLSITDSTKKPLEINIVCSDWAKAQYYPLD